MRLSITHPLKADSSIANQQPRTLGGACCGLQQCSQGTRGLWSPWQATLGIRRWDWEQSLPHAPGSLACFLTRSHAAMQLRDLNKGTFGFVQLALDTESNTQVAIKFIERGDKVGCNALQSALKYSRMCCCLAGCLTAICCAADFQVCGTGNTESQASESPSHCGAQGGQHCC